MEAVTKAAAGPPAQLRIPPVRHWHGPNPFYMLMNRSLCSKACKAVAPFYCVALALLDLTEIPSFRPEAEESHRAGVNNPSIFLLHQEK